LSLINEKRGAGKRIATVDYDVYAEGEAVLGWLNASVRLKGADLPDWQSFASSLLRQTREALKSSNSEPAHIKFVLSTSSGMITGNLTGSDDQPSMWGHVEGRPLEASLTVNARAHLAPEALRAV